MNPNIGNMLDAIVEYQAAKQKRDADLQRNIDAGGSYDWGYSMEANETQDRMDMAMRKFEAALTDFIFTAEKP